MAVKSMFDDPQELFAFCSVLRDNGNTAQAIAIAREALASHANNPEMATVARVFLSNKVHNYHRLMLADGPRNDFYEAMINANVKGKKVLDIGTGTGLLAMMAVRAGAEHVYACEVNSNKADLARDIIERNGMSDKITLFDAYSLDLDREKDLDGGVDVVLQELFTANVIGETLIQALAHAQRELANPGAILLPPKVAVMGALADVYQGEPVGKVSGFDLSLLEERLTYYALIDPWDAEQYVRSDATSLCDMEFLPDVSVKLRDKQTTRFISKGGRVNGVLYWMRIESEGVQPYENAPGGGRELHWSIRFEPFVEPVETMPGDVIAVGCAHNSNEIIIWNASNA